VDKMSRIHALDSARATLLLLGVLFHSAVFVYLYQEPASLSEFLVVTYLHQLLHAFRMPAFFVISGFFAAYLLETRDTRMFLGNRLSRIALPLAIFWLPLTFANGWASQGSWISGRDSFSVLPIDFQHLWFLFYLVIYSFIFAGTGKVISGLVGRRIHPVSTMLLIGSLAPVLPGVLDGEGTLGTSTGIFPEPGLLLWYLVIFLSGTVAYHQREFWLQYLKRSAILFTGLFLTLFTVFFFVQDWGPALTDWIYGSAVVLGSYAAIGLFLRFGDNPSKGMRFVSDASYWLYLVHLPLVFIFLVGFSANGFGAFATIALSGSLTLFFGLLSYKVLVRHTVISNLLNGKRHPLRVKKPDFSKEA
jgi:glucan biosynthesis protein C